MARRSFKVTVNGETFNVEVEEVKKSGKATSSENKNIESKPVTSETPVKTDDKKKKEEIKAAEKDVEKKDQDNNQEAEASSGGTVVPAPMPGAVLEVKVKEGDAVSKDDVLIILEAMKMENEITSPVSGKVSRVKVAKGSAVNSKDPLIIIE